LRLAGHGNKKQKENFMSCLNFRDWWDSVGINLMPKGDEPPEHAAIAESAWYAAIEANKSVPAKTLVIASEQRSDLANGAVADVDEYIDTNWKYYENENKDERATAWGVVHQYCLDNGMDQFIETQPEEITETGIKSVLNFIKHLKATASL
jgi:hypothetical protein